MGIQNISILKPHRGVKAIPSFAFKKSMANGRRAMARYNK
jgi:hypothetical protein